MIWNGDCVIDGCERETMTALWLCRKHSGGYQGSVYEVMVFDHTVEYGRRRFWLFGPRKRRQMTPDEVEAMRANAEAWLRAKWGLRT